MSLRVLVITEDPTYNGAIVKPLVRRMLAECGRGNAKVRVLTDPRPAGFSDAVRLIRGDLCQDYSDHPLWMFLPDADLGSEAKLAALEKAVTGPRVTLITCAAKPEVEAWLLAGHHERLNLSWRDVVNHTHLKEDVFQPFLRIHGAPASADGGRGALMQETLANYRGLIRLCPELAGLEGRLRAWLADAGR